MIKYYSLIKLLAYLLAGISLGALFAVLLYPTTFKLIGIMIIMMVSLPPIGIGILTSAKPWLEVCISVLGLIGIGSVFLGVIAVRHFAAEFRSSIYFGDIIIAVTSIAVFFGTRRCIRKLIHYRENRTTPTGRERSE